MFVEPRAKQWSDFVGQTHREIEAPRRSGFNSRFDDMLELMIRDLRDDRRDPDVAGHSCIVQRLDRGEPLQGLRCPWLEGPGDLRIE
jgi:hypothetical protein